MATTPTVYVICDKNCKFEGMTKEQIIAAILQAVNEGTISDIDAGFITTIKTINGLPLKFFVGEQAAYDELSEEEKTNLFAVITNDTTQAGINAAIKSLENRADALEELARGFLVGGYEVAWATNATNATNATKATKAQSVIGKYSALTAVTGGASFGTLNAGTTYLITIVRGNNYTFAMNFLVRIPTQTHMNGGHTYSNVTWDGYFLSITNGKATLMKLNGQFGDATAEQSTYYASWLAIPFVTEE